MAANSGQVSVTNAAPVLIADAGRLMLIRNTDATVSVFLGGAAVSSSTGYELKAGQSIELDAREDKVYAIAAAAGPVRVDFLAVRRADD